MSLVFSNMLELGSDLIPFELENANTNLSESKINIQKYAQNKAVFVLFMCNHCPFVILYKKILNDIYDYCEQNNVAMVAINANDEVAYPDDSFENMTKDCKEFGYKFPYLQDTTQEVAKAYLASCTPDVFLFDDRHRLVYRGQIDDARVSNDIKPTGKDIMDAIKALQTGEIIQEQKMASGCNIKWKEGNHPEYFTPKPKK